MAKDYAKYTRKNKRALFVKGWRTRLFVFIFLLAMIVMTSVGFFVWKSHSEDIMTFYTKLKSYIDHRSNQKIEVKNEVENRPKPEVQFHFYTELPKIQVTVPSPDLKPDSPQKEQYVVQFGVFQHAKDASEMRISLLLAGFEVSLIKTEAGYILQDGPFKNLSDAKKMQATLMKKGYENTTVAPL